MKTEHLPDQSRKYWGALILASVFGANTGDFLSDALGLGHVQGLPVLAVVFAAILLAERFDRFRHPAYFWSAIIIVRSAATNIGDIGRDLHVEPLKVLALLTAVLLATLAAWRSLGRTRPVAGEGGKALATSPWYWWTMLVAGSLGTVIGDYFSWGLKLGNLTAALVLFAGVTVLFLAGGRARLAQFGYYWLTVVAIRSAGTALGDFLAHTTGSLPVSTLVSGLAFVALLVLWRTPAGAFGPTPEPVRAASAGGESFPRP